MGKLNNITAARKAWRTMRLRGDDLFKEDLKRTLDKKLLKETTDDAIRELNGQAKE